MVYIAGWRIRVAALLVASTMAQAACSQEIDWEFFRRTLSRTRAELVSRNDAEFRVHRRMGAQQKLVEVLDRLARLTPSDPAVSHAQAQVRSSLGPARDVKKAVAHYKQFLRLTDDLAHKKSSSDSGRDDPARAVARRVADLSSDPATVKDLAALREDAMVEIERMEKAPPALHFPDRKKLEEMQSKLERDLKSAADKLETSRQDLRDAERRKANAESDYAAWKRAPKRGFSDPQPIVDRINSAKEKIKKLEDRDIPKQEKERRLFEERLREVESASRRFEKR